MVLGTLQTLFPPGSGSNAIGLAVPVIHRQQTFMILCPCTRSASLNPSISPMTGVGTPHQWMPGLVLMQRIVFE